MRPSWARLLLRECCKLEIVVEHSQTQYYAVLTDIQMQNWIISSSCAHPLKDVGNHIFHLFSTSIVLYQSSDVDYFCPLSDVSQPRYLPSDFLAFLNLSFDYHLQNLISFIAHHMSQIGRLPSLDRNKEFPFSIYSPENFFIWYFCSSWDLEDSAIKPHFKRLQLINRTDLHDPHYIEQYRPNIALHKPQPQGNVKTRAGEHLPKSQKGLTRLFDVPFDFLIWYPVFIKPYSQILFTTLSIDFESKLTLEFLNLFKFL